MKTIRLWIEELPDSARYRALRSCGNTVLGLHSCSLISALYTIKSYSIGWSNQDYWTGIILTMRDSSIPQAGCAPEMACPKLADGTFAVFRETDRPNLMSSIPSLNYHKTDSDQVETSFDK